MILVQGFCPLKIKITQFPGGFRLNFLSYYTPTPGLSSNKIKGTYLGQDRQSWFFLNQKGQRNKTNFIV